MSLQSLLWRMHSYIPSTASTSFPCRRGRPRHIQPPLPAVNADVAVELAPASPPSPVRLWERSPSPAVNAGRRCCWASFFKQLYCYFVNFGTTSPTTASPSSIRLRAQWQIGVRRPTCSNVRKASPTRRVVEVPTLGKSIPTWEDSAQTIAW